MNEKEMNERFKDGTFKYRDDSINDERDVERHLLDIHSNNLIDVLSKDLILGVLDEKEKKFITSNIESAHEALHLIKDKKQAKYASDRLLLKAFTVALLNRNVKDNPLIELILSKQRDQLIGMGNNMDEDIAKSLEAKQRGDKKV